MGQLVEAPEPLAAGAAVLAGAADGVASDFDAPSDLPTPSPDAFEVPEAASPAPVAGVGLAEEYRSLYQPEPLN